MEPYQYILIILASLIVIFFLISFISYKITFYSKPRKKDYLEHIEFPPGKAFEPYYESMSTWIKELRSIPYEKVEIRSYDNLKLSGKLYLNDPNGPIDILFHGYRGVAERDFCGGAKESCKLNHNILLIDQRGCGESDGNTITFGIKERHDCISWVNYIINRFGKNCEIYLVGISMGSTTVLTATELGLPENVKSITADCGFSSSKGIILHTIKQMHLPSFMYFFVKMGGLIFGRFNIDESSTIKALKNCTTPILVVHGKNDSIVPCYMSDEIYNVIPSKKELLQIENCDHAMSFLIDYETYSDTQNRFRNE